MWQPVIERLHEARHILLTTHVGSDGDGLGSELALARTLRRQGKSVNILNPTVTQDRYQFLYTPGEILHHGPEHADLVALADLVVVLDINRWDRLGELGVDVRRSSAEALCIDHHPSPEHFGPHDVSDPGAAATGLMVHDLVLAMAGDLADDVVDPLYVAVMTDTGSFRFANTSPRAFAVAARLVERGARPDVLYRNVYEASSPGRMKLLGHVLTHLAYDLSGALVHFTITDRLLAECGVDRDEAEGFTDVVRAVNGSQVVLSFVETSSGGAKVSLRSKGEVLDVGAIARELGGGGHANASGVLDDRPLGEARDAILALVAERLRTRLRSLA